MATHATLEQAIATFIDPYLGVDYTSAKALKNLQLTDNKAKIEIEVGYPVAGCAEELIKQLTHAIQQTEPNLELDISMSANILPHVSQRGVKGIKSIKNIIAIASGKGGVGKSTTAVNMALALHTEGAKVGILDADIYGPSQPQMLGTYSRPAVEEGKHMRPIEAHGLQAMSIGFLVGQKAPMVWRGPMVSGALQQLLNDTQWDELDYLIVDLPPGTGDIQLTLAQKIPVSGAVVVTTPQDLSLLDARRAIGMFQKVGITTLGVVENMSVHICSQCGHHEAIFGDEGGEKIAKEFCVDLLGSLPLAKHIREQADGGCPTVAADPNSDASQLYRDIARKVAAKLSLQGQDKSFKFPEIVVEKA